MTFGSYQIGVAVTALIVSTAQSAAAQAVRPTAKPMPEEKAGLLAQARVTPDAARRIALARVADGRIKSEEIEVEAGKLAYSFDITVAGKRGIEEILVDAKTGAVISQSHETPEQEAAEARADAGKAATRKRP